MKHFYIFIYFIGFGSFAQSPEVSWVQTGGADYSDGILSIDRDESGNVLVAGFYNNAAQFGTATLPDGAFTMFTAKYSSSGSLLWIKNFQNEDFINVRALKVDSQGNFVIVGDYYVDTDFDPSGNEYLLPGGSTGFIAKYDSDGNFLWAGSLEGENYYVIYDVDFDQNENIYITGQFTTSVDLDIKSTEAIVTGHDDPNMFAASYTSNGDYLWGFALETDGRTNGRGIAVRDSSVYITGECFQSGDFDPSAAQAIKTVEWYGHYIAKYTISGAYEWANVFESATDSFDLMEVVAIEADNSGNIYVLGDFTESFDADPSANTSIITGNDFFNNAFLAKYDTLGNYLWAVTAASDSVNPGSSRPFFLSVDNAGNSAIGGLLDGKTTLNSFSGSQQTELTGEADIFTALYDPNGQLKAAISFGSNDEGFKQFQNDYIGGLILTEDELYIGGRFTTTTNFSFPDNAPFELTLAANAMTDAFLAKYAVESLGATESQEANWLAYPNPVQDILYVHGLDSEAQLFDVRGRKLASYPAQSSQIDMSSFETGIYLLKTKTVTLKVLKK